MTISSRKRVLIVDDSAVMRSLLRSVIAADPRLEVAGTAMDGAAALDAVGTLHPDLVLLDVEMPVMDGLKALGNLRARGCKMPVIICSALTQRGARVTLEALAAGATDYVAKPAGQSGPDAAAKALSRELLPKIHALTAHPPMAGGYLTPKSFPGPSAAAPGTQPPEVLVVGVSTGGPAALEVLLPVLPEGFPLPVLVVQHMPELFTRLFAERLNCRCRLPVREAAEGDPVRKATISIARGNWHMEILAAAHPSAPPSLHLHQGCFENHCRPAVDVLFRSAAAVYGAGVLAVVLTGMGTDGLLGCRTVHSVGGTVIAQDQASSAVWGMPGAVAKADLAQRVLPLAAIAPEILNLACGARMGAGESREPVT